MERITVLVHVFEIYATAGKLNSHPLFHDLFLKAPALKSLYWVGNGCRLECSVLTYSPYSPLFFLYNSNANVATSAPEMSTIQCACHSLQSTISKTIFYDNSYCPKTNRTIPKDNQVKGFKGVSHKYTLLKWKRRRLWNMFLTCLWRKNIVSWIS